MNQPDQRAEVLWLGTAQSAFGWLQTRIAERCRVTPCESWHGIGLPEVFSRRFDRVVVVCRDRLSYPDQLLRELTQAHPEIPIAVAVDNWWDGAGRTGLRRRTHVVLPWYRWWDGWIRWLDGVDCGLCDPCPGPNSHSLHDDLRCKELPMTMQGLVIANCKATATAWVQVANQFKLKAIPLSNRKFLAKDFGGQTAVEPSWFLWDDSSLDTLSTSNEAEQCAQVFRLATSRYPHAVRCAAFAMPRWGVWQCAARHGAQEILVKPNTGAALGRILADRF